MAGGTAYVLTRDGTYERTSVYGSSADGVDRKLTPVLVQNSAARIDRCVSRVHDLDSCGCR